MRTRNRATVEHGGHLILPGFSLFNAGTKNPHRKRVLARHVGENGVTYEVIANWPRTRWWVYANKAGFRMSNTATTSSREVAEAWIRAVVAGDVSVANRDREGKR